MKSRLLGLAVAVASAWMAGAPLPAAAAPREKSPAWVTAWATSQQGLGPTKISNATVRMIARVTVPGESVRVRLDNTFGTAPVVFGRATIGLRARGPAVAAGVVRPLTFGGKASVTVAAGASATSDPVALRVEALQDVAVSLFVARCRRAAEPAQQCGGDLLSHRQQRRRSVRFRGRQAVLGQDHLDALAQIDRRDPGRPRHHHRGLGGFHHRRHLLDARCP